MKKQNANVQSAVMSSRPKLRLDWCSFEAAKYACEKWHYSACTPKYKQVWIGAWEDDRFIGLIAFGTSSTPYLGKRFGLNSFQCAELTRVALNRHVTPVSRMLAIACKMMKRQSPGMRLFVSLADTRQLHHGGIYQAAGWIYVGLTKSCTQHLYRGKWRNDSSLHRDMKANAELRQQLKKRVIPGKHKYLYPLDAEIRQRIEPLRKPYPKRASEV